MFWIERRQHLGAGRVMVHSSYVVKTSMGTTDVCSHYARGSMSAMIERTSIDYCDC